LSLALTKVCDQTAHKGPGNGMDVGFFRGVEKALLDLTFPPVCPLALISVHTGRNIMKLNILGFLKSVAKCQVSLKSAKNNGYFVQSLS